MAVGQDDRERARQSARDFAKLSPEGKAYVMAAARRMDTSTNQRNRMIRNELRSQPSGTALPKNNYGKAPAAKVVDSFKRAYNDPDTNLGALRRGANKVGKFFSGGNSNQRDAARRRLYAANKR